MCVGCLRYSARPWDSPLRSRCQQLSNLLRADLSPESLTCVSPRGFTQLLPSCNSNYLGYNSFISYEHPHNAAQKWLITVNCGQLAPQGYPQLNVD
ncbi:hypothetical protein DVQ41_07430 [Yersinia enterocolitica]|nr:hypothetical protein [Yersinia enterocolitica]EKN4927001.1 hypothetical protein [Yersinia enterocolitica]EKN4931082.1 hypothetical protein [Yersinia enterocolitica]EKN5013391.1 hypothetical protein [Yersinia enterocolitica]EKN5025931.1 hypothetical protein [Yersinia enterocolitica]